MAKMYIMQGLPASGKSTRAQEIVERDGNTVRINKDLIRTMLHFDNFTGKNEGLTREAARTLAEHFLARGLNVVIDDTNLNERTRQGWVDLAKDLEAKIEHVKIETGWQECVLRDRKRQKPIGGDVIKNMALQYGMLPDLKKGWILCDLDGTLCDITHRLHFVKKPEGEKKDWKNFFANIAGDSLREDVSKMLIDFYNEGYGVIFLSARPEDYKSETLAWLEEHAMSFAFTLIMRRSGDKRPDEEVKKDLLDTYFPDKSVIHKVIDDRPKIIRMWKENGLDVIDVGQGIEF